jgi:hypothetical protein
LALCSLEYQHNTGISQVWIVSTHNENCCLEAIIEKLERKDAKQCGDQSVSYKLLYEGKRSIMPFPLAPQAIDAIADVISVDQEII